MDQESEPKPTVRPPDLSGPPNLSQPVLSQPTSVPPPNLSGPAVRPPDLPAPAPSAPPPSIPQPTVPVPPDAPAVTGPPTLPIPESARKRPSEPKVDEDALKVGDIAPFNTRIIAGAIDWGVCLCLYVVITAILPRGLHFMGALAWLGYLLTKDSLPFIDGQSIGKRVMKLRAVTAHGKPLTGDWQTGILRNAFQIIAPVEFFILLNREEKPEAGRRLGDDVARTKVIYIGDPAPPESPGE